MSIAISVAVWAAAFASLAHAADKLAAPGAVRGQRTTITVKADAEAGQFERQTLDILGNGEATCRGLDLTGAIFAPVIGHVTFTTVDFGFCVYLGSPARVNSSSCDVLITSGGLGKLTSRAGGKCDLRIEVPGCTVHLGKGPFLELGYHNVGSPAEVTALTEPVAFGGTAIGAACQSPGSSALARYTGYLRLIGSRDGAKTPFTVIL